MIRVFLTLLMVCIFSPFLAGQGEGVSPAETSLSPGSEQIRLSLEQSILLALENNLDLEVQRLTLASAERDPLIAEAAFDPLFRTGFTISKSSTTSTSIIEGAAVGEQSDRDNRTYFLGLSGQLRYGTTWNLRLNGKSIGKSIQGTSIYH